MFINLESIFYNPEDAQKEQNVDNKAIKKIFFKFISNLKLIQY